MRPIFLKLWFCCGLKVLVLAGQWLHMPLIPALGRQKQVNLCEFKGSLAYKASFRRARAKQWNTVLKNRQKVLVLKTLMSFVNWIEIVQRLMRFRNVNLGWEVKSSITELRGRRGEMAIHDFFLWLLDLDMPNGVYLDLSSFTFSFYLMDYSSYLVTTFKTNCNCAK